MGAHKYNPTAIAANNGELPPKKKTSTMSKRQFERLVTTMIENRLGITKFYDRGLHRYY